MGIFFSKEATGCSQINAIDYSQADDDFWWCGNVAVPRDPEAFYNLSKEEQERIDNRHKGSASKSMPDTKSDDYKWIGNTAIPRDPKTFYSLSEGEQERIHNSGPSKKRR